MLIGNLSVLNKNPGRDSGGNSTALASGIGGGGSIRSSLDKPSNWRKFSQRDNSGATFTSLNHFAAKPNGYYPQGVYAFPDKAGYLSAVNRANVEATFTGSGALGRNLTFVATGIATTLSAIGQLVVSGFASIANHATVSSNAYAALAGVASIACGTTVASSLLAKGWVSGSLAQTTSVVAVRYATGLLEADILPYTELSPQNLATAVWDENLETNYAARELMRVITSALAGKISGAETSTVTIRDINDGKNRITATVDGNGNRTTITIDATE